MSKTFVLPTRNLTSDLLLKPRQAWSSALPHYSGARFFNPWIKDNRDFAGLFNWLLTRERDTWPQNLANAPFIPPTPHLSDNIADWKVWFVGHATLLLQIGPWNFLTDPVWSERCSPFSRLGPKRVRPAGIALEDLPPIHAVLLSHNHYDHLDMATLIWLHEHHASTIVTGLGNAAYLLPYGLSVVELDWWESHAFDQEVHLHYVPARHFSGRGMRDRNAALWGGFSIKTAGGHAYFAGDTGYAPHFTEIRERLGAPRLALLPIGAYEPRALMKEVHMNPEEAVLAHRDLGAARSVGIHFNTFQLTDEAIDSPVADMRAALFKHAVESEAFRVLSEGEGWSVP